MFEPIDLKNWPREQMYMYFSRMAPTGYSVTAEVDVTRVLDTVHREGLRFFPAYLWLVTRNLMRQREFRCALKDGVLGCYDALTPLYASFHEDDKTFSLMWTPFSPAFRDFHAAYMENRRLYGDNHGVVCRPELPPENAYTVSALPWVSFSHFAVHSFENKDYYFPSVEAGRYAQKDGRMMMPLSLTCHHAVTDGYHVKTFLEDLQRDMDRFDELI